MAPFYTEQEITNISYFKRKELEMKANHRAGEDKFNFNRKRELEEGV